MLRHKSSASRGKLSWKFAGQPGDCDVGDFLQVNRFINSVANPLNYSSLNRNKNHVNAPLFMFAKDIVRICINSNDMVIEFGG